MKALLSTLALGLALGLPAAAEAAPLVKADQATTSAAQPVACWWRHGVRHCDGVVLRRAYPYRANRRHYGPYYGYGPTIYPPSHYRTGSTKWWRSMDAYGLGGYRR